MMIAVRSANLLNMFDDQMSFYVAFIIYGFGTGISSTALVTSFPPVARSITLTAQIISLAIMVARGIAVNRGVWMGFVVNKWNAFTSDSRLRRLIVLFCVTLIAALSSFVTDDLTLLWLSVFVFASKGIEFKSVAKASLVLNAALIMIALLLCCTGVTQNLVFMRDGVQRSGMGFLHPNTFGLRVLQICIALFVLRYRRFRSVDYLVVIACAAITWVTCNSRLSVVMMLALAFLVMPMVNLVQTVRPHTVIAICALILLLCLAFSTYFMLFYEPSNGVHQLLNDVLSGRLYLMHYYYSTYPPLLFGQNMTEATTNMLTYYVDELILDNAYVRMIEVHGVLLTFIFAIFWLLAYRRAWIDNRVNVELITLTLYAIIGVVETAMISVASNYALLGFGRLLYPGAGSTSRNDSYIDMHRDGKHFAQ